MDFIYENIEVSLSIYNAYRRTDWSVEKNNQKHSYNTICFSDMKCPQGKAIEELKEFASDKYNPEENLIEQKESMEKVNILLDKCLSKDKKRRFLLYYFEGYTLEEISKLEGVCTSGIFRSIRSAVKDIKQFVNKQ